MRFLSHLLAAVLAVVALAPTLDAATTSSRATATHAAHTSSSSADTQPPILSEDDPRWVCWAQGNRECSTVPLDGPGDGPATGQTSGLDTTGAVCTSDADCAAYDLARGVVSDGRP